MQPKEFTGHNIKIAEDQPQYITLPAFVTPTGEVITCWQLTDEEKARIAETGEIWVSIMTFNTPLQPMLITTDRKEVLKYLNEYTREEITKLIFDEAPKAQKTMSCSKDEKPMKIYKTQLTNGLDVFFEVPLEEMGEKPFKDEIDAALLTPWLTLPEDLEKNPKK